MTFRMTNIDELHIISYILHGEILMKLLSTVDMSPTAFLLIAKSKGEKPLRIPVSRWEIILRRSLKK
jgi:hypothetical protein